MNTVYYAHEFNDLIKIYDEVCNWFSELGFDYLRTRYGLYKKHFETFFEIINKKKKVDNILEFKNAFDNAYLELNEIIRVYTSLKNINKIEFRPECIDEYLNIQISE